jgi:hypothetical protein
MSDPVKSQDTLRWGAWVRVLLPGLVAWLITVLEPAWLSGASPVARGAAVLAFVVLAAGALLFTSWPLVGRVLGLHAFVAFCLLAWAMLRAELSPGRIDPVRAALGGFAWMLFAFGWGHVRDRAPAEEAAIISGPPLQPRSRLPRTSLVVVLFAVITSVGLSALAFRVDRPEHAMFGHAAATAASLLVLAAGGRIALAQGTRHDLASPGSRFDGAAVPSALIGVLLGLGLVWAALR